jgi:hypothetical protein
MGDPTAVQKTPTHLLPVAFQSLDESSKTDGPGGPLSFAMAVPASLATRTLFSSLGPNDMSPRTSPGRPIRPS